MRSFTRHSSDIPVNIQLEDLAGGGEDFLKDVSHGGLAFFSNGPLETDAVIRLSIPSMTPPFEAMGRVIWCRANGQRYEVGVKFQQEDDEFLARMVEQICRIEQYRQEILEKEGRKLSSEQAAEEWIAKYANDFPAIK